MSGQCGDQFGQVEIIPPGDDPPIVIEVENSGSTHLCPHSAGKAKAIEAFGHHHIARGCNAEDLPVDLLCQQEGIKQRHGSVAPVGGRQGDAGSGHVFVQCRYDRIPVTPVPGLDEGMDDGDRIRGIAHSVIAILPRCTPVN